jgi:hypothetical protein
MAMWIGAIKLTVQTKDATDAGTDSLVRAGVLRDGNELARLRLDYEDENDLERGAIRNYFYSDLPRKNDQTPELPDGIGQSPMPYPDHGFEFSNGVNGHMKLRLRIYDDDMWIKDNVDLYVKEIRNVATSFDTLAWKEDANWTYLGSWSADVAMSTDADEGRQTWTLNLQ